MSKSFRGLLGGVAIVFVVGVIWALIGGEFTGQNRAAEEANRRRRECEEIVLRIDHYYTAHKAMPKTLSDALAAEPGLGELRPLDELENIYSFTFAEAQSLIDSGKQDVPVVFENLGQKAGGWVGYSLPHRVGWLNAGDQQSLLGTLRKPQLPTGGVRSTQTN